MLLVIWANALSMLASSSSEGGTLKAVNINQHDMRRIYVTVQGDHNNRDSIAPKIGPIASRVVGSFEPLENFETTVIEETDARCTVNPWDKMEDYRGN